MRKYVSRAVPRIAALLLLAAAAATYAAENKLSGKALVDALRRGGYTIYFRHAATEWSQDDHVLAEGDWRSCDPDRMRQLSDEGRAQALRIGEHIRSLNIPVSRVLSSEYCRTRETARLMDLGPVSPTRTLMNMRAAGFAGGREAVVERARQEIGRRPEKGANTVLVAHGNLMEAASGAYTDEGGAAVFAPGGDGTFTLVALVAAEDWARLAGEFASQSE
jgi:phosphohistidine phosphatase SixA